MGWERSIYPSYISNKSNNVWSYVYVIYNIQSGLCKQIQENIKAMKMIEILTRGLMFKSCSSHSQKNPDSDITILILILRSLTYYEDGILHTMNPTVHGHLNDWTYL